MAGGKKTVQRSNGAKTVIQPGKGIIGNVGGKGTTPPSATPTQPAASGKGKRTAAVSAKSYPCLTPNVCGRKTHRNKALCHGYVGEEKYVEMVKGELYGDVVYGDLHYTDVVCVPEEIALEDDTYFGEYNKTYLSDELETNPKQLPFYVTSCLLGIQRSVGNEQVFSPKIAENKALNVRIQKKLTALKDVNGFGILQPEAYDFSIYHGPYGDEVDGLWFKDPSMSQKIVDVFVTETKPYVKFND